MRSTTQLLVPPVHMIECVELTVHKLSCAGEVMTNGDVDVVCADATPADPIIATLQTNVEIQKKSLRIKNLEYPCSMNEYTTH